MLIETALPYWAFAQKLNRSASSISRRLIVDHEVLPAVHVESNPMVKNLLMRLVIRAAA